jgi:hypothetical protein
LNKNIRRNVATLNFSLFVRQSWSKYDPFDNGWLSKEEFRQFLVDSFRAEESDRILD